MGLQLEPGTVYPLRWRASRFTVAPGDLDVSQDTSPVDWGAGSGATHKIQPVETETVNEEGKILIRCTGHDVFLRDGIWEIHLHPIVTNGEVDDQTVEIAITDEPGTTVHAESGPVIIPAGCSAQPKLTALVEITSAQAQAGGTAVLALRAAQSSAGSAGELTLNANVLAEVIRVGNAGEGSQAFDGTPA